MILTLDTETTTFQKGNPFSVPNKLCCVGYKPDNAGTQIGWIEYDLEPYHHELSYLKALVENAELLVGFNIKFDLHWIRRYINDIRFPVAWDCQLADFILGGQRNPFSSLDECLARNGLPPKLDIVREQYWSRGLDTTDVPRDILSEYLTRDVEATYELYQIQKAQLLKNPDMYLTFKMQCEDLLGLAEAEFIGMKLNVELCKERATAATLRRDAIATRLADLGSCSDLNWGSSDHVSIFLFGGSIDFPVRVATERVLKDGTRKVGEKWGVRRVDFPRQIAPNPRSEQGATRDLSEDELDELNRERCSKELKPLQRLYSVDEDSLRSLKATGKIKEIIDLLLEYSKLKKIIGTYYKGLPKRIEEMQWEDNTMHGSFNQCAAITGRLSSSKPNLQNLHGGTKELYVSRYS